jgi:hypothetical protein
MLCCAVLVCAGLCCAVLCCAVRCCAKLHFVLYQEWHEVTVVGATRLILGPGCAVQRVLVGSECIRLMAKGKAGQLQAQYLRTVLESLAHGQCTRSRDSCRHLAWPPCITQWPSLHHSMASLHHSVASLDHSLASLYHSVAPLDHSLASWDQSLLGSLV